MGDVTDEHILIDTDDRQVAASASGEAVIHDALAVIDDALARMMKRELVSSGEVADLLLDVRSLLTADATPQR